MNYTDERLRNLLSAEYVLGTLQGLARRRFERLLRDDRALRREVIAWERRFAGLQRTYPPQTPRPVVWSGIEAQVHGQRVHVLPPPVPITADRGPLRFWRAAAAASLVAAAGLGYALWWTAHQPVEIVERVLTVEVPTARPAPFVAMLQPDAPVQWVAMVDPSSQEVKLSAAGSYPLDPESEDLQLWFLDAEGMLHPVGMLPPEGGSAMTLPKPVNEHCMLAISLEPKGGSPTGKPTGPVLATAPLQAF